MRTENYVTILERYDGTLARILDRTYLRLRETGCSPDEEVSAAVTYTVMPVLLYFVEWVLQQAKEEGKRRLYFLARDGYLMYHMAKQLCREYGITIECRYLYGSRYAWRIPEYHLDWKGCVEKMCLGGLRVSFFSMMRRGGLEGEEIRRAAGEFWPELSEQEREAEILREISRVHQKEWKKRLSESLLLKEMIDSKSEKAYRSTIGYLKQEGLFDGTEYALVDSGWVGSIQLTLSRLLHSVGYDKTPVGYYYGLYSLPSGAKSSDYRAWYFSPSDGLKNKASFNNCLYECMISSPEGSCTGYEYDARQKRFIPSLDSGNHYNREQIMAEKKVMDLFLQEYCGRGTGRESPGEAVKKKCVRKLMKRLMTHPTMAEARYFGSFRFSDDVTDTEGGLLANRLSETDFRKKRLISRLTGCLKKQDGPEGNASAWMEGSIVLYAKHPRRELRNEQIHRWLLNMGKQAAALYQRWEIRHEKNKSG